MEVKEIFDQALNSNYLIIEEDELKSVLENSEIIRVEDTHLSDLIRVLKYDEKLFVQETTFKNEILIRKMDSMKDVDFIVQERLDYYERKWMAAAARLIIINKIVKLNSFQLLFNKRDPETSSG